MPALITHHLFGEEGIDRLPAGIIGTDEERTAFLIANQGPDPYFFRVRTPRMASCMSLARSLHRCRISRQFEALRTGVEHLYPRDAHVGRAFVLGLFSHYALDRAAHPFVYAQQWGAQEVDPSLDAAASQVHAIIESDIDVFMLQLKRNGATVEDCPPERELVTSARIDKVAGALMSYVASSVYGIEIGAQEYGGAVADMQLAYRVIEPADSPACQLLGALEGAVRGNSILAALAHRVTAEPPLRAGNMGHLAWKNPFTDVESHESFPEVFDRALDEYERDIACLIAGDPLEQATHHLNYSGRPLGEAEELDQDD